MKPIIGLIPLYDDEKESLWMLYQDLSSEYGEKIEHHMAPPYDRIVHKVDVTEGTKLWLGSSVASRVFIS